MTSLFINTITQDLSTDFRLFNLIQSLKYKVFLPLTFRKPQLRPIIVIPGLGASKIYGMWNKGPVDTAKFLDGAGVFEMPSEWNCRTLQPELTDLWPHEFDEDISKYCWADNIRVRYDQERILNSPGVVTQVAPMGELPEYMGDLVRALESIGYQQGRTLFGAQYDFRKLPDPSTFAEYNTELRNLIETCVSQTGLPAVIISHDLGSQVANGFLTKMPKEWKDTYVSELHVVSGTFGGCPKALRTIMSGDAKDPILREAYKNFGGLLWMLPCPELYGDIPLVRYRGVGYSAKDIPMLLGYAKCAEASEIYQKIVHPAQMESMRAPGVPVYVYSGNNVPTESNYVYERSLTESPVLGVPVQNNELPWSTDSHYPTQFNGDGTMPKFALEHPMQWSKYQREPVYYHFYDKLEHNDILNHVEPIQDILGVLLGE